MSNLPAFGHWLSARLRYFQCVWCWNTYLGPYDMYELLNLAKLGSRNGLIIGLAPAKKVKWLLTDVSPTPYSIVYWRPETKCRRKTNSHINVRFNDSSRIFTMYDQFLHYTSVLKVKICNFIHMKYLLFVSFGWPDYQPPMFTVGTSGSLCAVLLIAGLLLQQLLTTSLWQQPKGQ